MQRKIKIIKVYWGAKSSKERKSISIFCYFQTKYEMECTLVVKLPNNQRAAQWLKRTQWKPLTPPAGTGSVKPFD